MGLPLPRASCSVARGLSRAGGAQPAHLVFVWLMLRVPQMRAHRAVGVRKRRRIRPAFGARHGPRVRFVARALWFRALRARLACCRAAGRMRRRSRSREPAEWPAGRAVHRLSSVRCGRCMNAPRTGRRRAFGGCCCACRLQARRQGERRLRCERVVHVRRIRGARRFFPPMPDRLG